ncbi:MAG: serine hydrolase domain-containing protein [Asgard group archaeon]|nr:serine hydrolase domain-containing protein [Asgard group archaeon]
MFENKAKKKLIKNALHLIDKWLDFQIYINEIPGTAAGIFVDDEIIFKKEYGYADKEKKVPLTADHWFRIASHSKLFTATAIMKLYSEDKLSLDDRISKHLPWFISEEDENLQNVRIRHLLTYSSGISRDGKTAHWNTYEFPELEDIKKQVQKGISFFEASEILKYSNFEFTILGQIIEVVTGKTYHEYIRQEILDPLEMKNTFTKLTEKNIGNHAQGYGIKFPKEKRKKLPHIPAKIMHAATGYSSNVSDLMKFYQAHFFENEKLLPDQVKREMQRIQFKSKDDERGLGFGITNVQDMKIIGHGGGYPGFITRSGFIKGEKTIVVILTNAIDGPAKTLFQGIIKLIRYLIEQKETLVNEKDEKNFEKIIGFYQSDWGITLFSQIGSKLVGIDPHNSNPAEVIQIYNHITENTFKAPKNRAFASPGQEINFIEDSNGQMIFIDSHGGKNPTFKFDY